MAEKPHPEVQDHLDMLAGMDAPAIHELEPEKARGLFDSTFRHCSPVESVEEVTDRTIEGPGGEISIRIYGSARRKPRALAAWRERSSRCTRKASLFEDGDESDVTGNKPPDVASP